LNADHVEIVRQVLEQWNRGEIEGLLEHTTEDLEWHPVLVASVEGAAFRGHEGFREFLTDWKGAWVSWNLEAEEFREFGDQVLVLTRVRAKGRGSGLEFDQSLAHLFEFRGDLVCRGETFLDREQAIEVAERRREHA
jgi:ketosteroid isomerase-like protein